MGVKQERDALTLIREKKFLGQDFLTWLWSKAEERGGAVLVPGHGDVAVTFERFMALEEGEGDASESLTCRGRQTELREARVGLRAGKKVARAHIRIGMDDEEWRLTLDGATLDVKSLRTSKTPREGEEEGGDIAFEGRVLERAFLLQKATDALDLLFKAFLSTRVNPRAWEEERQRLAAWIGKGG
jgi:hypothetical protein